MQPNKKQIEILHKAASGEIALPGTSKELHKLLCDTLLTRDHEAEESPMLEKCKKQFIKLAQQKSNADGWVYLSVIKCQLKRRAYYRDLERRLAARDIDDAIRHVARSMIRDGFVKRNGAEVMITQAAADYLEQEEF